MLRIRFPYTTVRISCARGPYNIESSSDVAQSEADKGWRGNNRGMSPAVLCVYVCMCLCMCVCVRACVVVINL